jgi:hypothetical protein
MPIASNLTGPQSKILSEAESGVPLGLKNPAKSPIRTPMKKILLAVCSALLLVGCSKSADNRTSSSDTGSAGAGPNSSVGTGSGTNQATVDTSGPQPVVTNQR